MMFPEVVSNWWVFMFNDALVKVSGCHSNIICITQITFKYVNNTILVYQVRFLLFRLKIMIVIMTVIRIDHDSHHKITIVIMIVSWDWKAANFMCLRSAAANLTVLFKKCCSSGNLNLLSMYKVTSLMQNFLLNFYWTFSIVFYCYSHTYFLLYISSYIYLSYIYLFNSYSFWLENDFM